MPNLLTILVTVVALFIAIRLSIPITNLLFPLLNKGEKEIPKKYKRGPIYNIFSSMVYYRVSVKTIGLIWAGIMVLTILVFNLVDYVFSWSISEQLFK